MRLNPHGRIDVARHNYAQQHVRRPTRTHAHARVCVCVCVCVCVRALV